MTILDKIRYKGVRGCVRSAIGKIAIVINPVIYRVCRFLPLQENSIIFESEGDLCDNSYALFETLMKRPDSKKYRIIWLLRDTDNLFKLKRYAFVEAACCDPFKINMKLYYYLARAKFYIYDHNNYLARVNAKKRKGQVVLYLTHGAGYKAPKSSRWKDKIKADLECMVCTGKIPKKILSSYNEFSESKIRTFGYPRNDYFYFTDDIVDNKIEDVFALSHYRKVIFWMPTFRKCDFAGISEDYIQNETGLPLIATRDQLNDINAFLNQHDILLVLKVHPLQADLEIFKVMFSNIMVVKNKDLSDIDVQLYQFIRHADALITDYSSISTDYQLLDRPIIYTLDDYDEYNSSRGIWPQNAIDFMKGYHIYTLKELKEAINDIGCGKDVYRCERNRMVDYFHDHMDGNASERIIDYLNL